MRNARYGIILLAIVAGASPLWSQRGGRGASGAASQAGAPAAAAPAAASAPTGAPAATGGRGGGGAATDEFYNFNPAAAQVRMDPNVDKPPVETQQKITVNGQPLAYTTHAGFLPLPNATTGTTEAHLFFTAYTKDGVSDAATRPIMFFFGGAPGVSAAWQEFGGFGPKRMKTEGGWADNPDTILNQADLVFVNPVGTGYSFPVQASRGSIFWSTAGDIASLAEFVRVYLDRNNRLASPLFITGEDVATGRVGGLTAYLTEHMIPVRGVVLLSLTPAADATVGDWQYINLMPSLTMASWFHKKLTPELNAMSSEQIAGQARQFAAREYLHALYNGDRLPAEARNKAVTDLARLTGLSKNFLINNDLRVSLDRYSAELMRDQRQSLSRTDARVSGYAPMTGGRGGGGGRGGTPIDFNMSKIAGPFAAAYGEYLRRELTFNARKDGIFYLSSGGVSGFTSTGNDDTSLSAAFARDPDLRLFAGINLFDLEAPFYAAEYTLAHLDVSPQVRDHNITVSHQEAGSMAYLDDKARVKLEKDLGGFIAAAAPVK